MRMPGRIATVLATVAVAALLWAAPGGNRAHAVAGLMPADPQPGAGALKPGLGVKYLIAKFNSLREIEEMATWSKPEPGEPLPMLNYNVGRGPVLSNRNTDLVGAFIDGYIRFDQAGTYLFAVQYNDGVRLSIGGEQIYEDPIVAPDRFSPNLEVQIETPGWYPISLLYYEKKNTSTLELYWQPPGTEGFVFVPAAAFGHVAGENPG